MASGGEKDTSFASCAPKLSDHTLTAVEKLGFKSMTPVQRTTIPLFLTNKDVCVEAVTGSGKTLAFVIPVVEMLVRAGVTARPRSNVAAMILSPTRELAIQINQVLQLFLEETDLRCALLVGGCDVATDMQRLQSQAHHILVGTPGRMGDVLQRCQEDVIDLRQLEVLVLDEADTLLDMGFSKHINDILTKLPKQRRTGLFSATQTKEVRALAKAGMRNPVVLRVKVQGADHQIQKTPTSLQNLFMKCMPEQKLPQLLRFMAERRDKKIVIFCLTCACVEYLAGVIQHLMGETGKHKQGSAGAGSAFPIIPMHGRMASKRRSEMFGRFRDAAAGVLLCTDVAARGIDLPDIDWIVQYDPPKDPSFFVHRVGRTARAGRSGQALVLLLPEEEAYVHFLGIHGVPLAECELFPDAEAPAIAETLRQLSLGDRDFLEKGTKAFITFLRGYREHSLAYIFRMELMPIGSLARSFGLLQLPKIKELRHHHGAPVGGASSKAVVPAAELVRDFEPTDVDTSTITFKDPVKEKIRQNNIMAKSEKIERLKAEREKKKAFTEVAQKAKPVRRKRKGQQKRMLEEWDELAREERLAKKLKQGRMTQAEFDAAMREGEELMLQDLAGYKQPEDGTEAGGADSSDDGGAGTDSGDSGDSSGGEEGADDDPERALRRKYRQQARARLQAKKQASGAMYNHLRQSRKGKKMRAPARRQVKQILSRRSNYDAKRARK